MPNSSPAAVKGPKAAASLPETATAELQIMMLPTPISVDIIAFRLERILVGTTGSSGWIYVL